MKEETIFVLLPPPCTNASLHMGHLSGVYILADIYTRYMRECGYNVVVLGGADQSSAYTLKKAIKENKTITEMQSLYTSLIKESLDLAQVGYDTFIETCSPNHVEIALNILNKLIENEFVAVKEVEQFYCENCNQYSVDAFVEGTCNQCNAKSGSGICENCNTPIFNYALSNAIHTECSSKLIKRPLKVFIFEIQKVKTMLANKIFESDWDDSIKKRAQIFLKNLHENPITLSYKFAYGLKTDKFNIEGNALTIWFEAVWVFYTGLANYYKTDLDGVIKIISDPAIKIVPFIGQDSEFLYTIGVSIISLGLGINRIPNMPAIQRFVKFDGQKFSSSRNHVIVLQELTKEFSVDVIRFYCMTIIFPYEQDDNNFDINELRKFNSLISRKLEHIALILNLDVVNSSLETNSNASLFEAKELVDFNHAMLSHKYHIASTVALKLIDTFLLKNEERQYFNSIASILWVLKPIIPMWVMTQEKKYLNNINSLYEFYKKIQHHLQESHYV